MVSPACQNQHDTTSQAADQTAEEVVDVARNNRQTGSKAASAAGKVLANPKSSKADKTAAASALAQTPSKSGKRK